MIGLPRKACLFVLLTLSAVCLLPAAAPLEAKGPWNLTALERPPAVTWGVRTGLVQEVYYEGEPLAGRPTRVFAYLGRPANPDKPRMPAVVLVHGGGGKAFREWAEHWAGRGYVALAMDLSGNGPAGRLPDGAPDQSDETKFRNFTAEGARDMWTYHAVAAVIRGHSLLRSLPDVDPERIGITGISWGGYLTCIVAGIDSRLKVAVPVYGCGFLGDNSYWTDKSLAAMTPEARALWLRNFDPSQYLAGVRCPILFLNGTIDFAYPLDSYQKSYRLVPPEHRHVSVIISLPHGHIWTFNEVDAFVDSVLRDGKPLPGVGPVTLAGNTARAESSGPLPLKAATWNYTTNAGPWQKREWKTIPARIEAHGVSVELPSERPLVGFFAVTDERGLRVSSEHISLELPQ